MDKGTQEQLKRLEIDKIQVTNPCSTDWEGMTGDDKTRFCDACNKRVYNLSAMTRHEIEALVRETNGRFCARMMRDADGSVITAAENSGFNLIRLRASKFASAVMTAALSLSPLVSTTAGANPPHRTQSEKESKRDLSATNAHGGTARIHGTIYDTAGLVVFQATITLTNQITYEQFVTISSGEGAFHFNAVPAGTYELKVGSPGFVLFKAVNLELSANSESRKDVILQPALLQGGASIGFDKLIPESLDTITIPELLLKPIKAIQLRVKEKNKKPARKKQNQKQ